MNVQKFYSVLAITTALAVMSTFISCQKEESTSGNIDSPYRKVTPTQCNTDQLSCKFDVPVATFGQVADGADSTSSNHQSLANALLKRLTWKDGVAKVAILDASYIASLSPEDADSIIGVFDNGGAVIFLNINGQSVLPLQDIANDTSYIFKKMLKWLEEIKNRNFMLKDGVIRNGEVYFTAMRPEQVSYSSEIVDPNTKEITPGDSLVMVEDGQVTDYTIGLQADAIVRWAEEEINGIRLNSENEKEICDLGMKLTILHIFNYDSNRQLSFKGENITRSIPAEERYTFWPVYIPAEKTDHYMIHRKFCFSGKELKCGPEDPEGYWSTGGNYGCYGPFLRGIYFYTFPNRPTAKMEDHVPENSIGSTSYSDGWNLTLGGGVSLGKNPSLDFTGTLSLTYSSSVDVPDLVTDVKWNIGCNPEVKYISGVRPINHWNWVFTNITHDIAKNGLRNDIILGQRWKYIMDSKPGDRFELGRMGGIKIDMLNCKNMFHYTKDIYMAVTFVFFPTFIPMPAPPRVDQEWKMDCNPKLPNIVEFLKGRYPEHYFNGGFHIAGDTEDDCEGIDMAIERFMKVVECDKDYWRNSGYTGNFVFSWKRANCPSIYKSRSFDVN